MKIDAVGITSSKMKRTIEFYTLLGFEFTEGQEKEDHVEPKTPQGSARLMIDAKKIISGILGEEPTPGNHSSFAIQFDSVDEINTIADNIKAAGFKLVKEPWDAVWGQRYAIVEDPDGYKVDLYCNL